MKPDQAVKDFKKVVELEPKNDTVKAQLAATVKLVKQIKFEKVVGVSLHYSMPNATLTIKYQAIEVEGEQSAVDRCAEIIKDGKTICSSTMVLGAFNALYVGGCEMDKAYVGPKLTLQDGKYSITAEFVTAMIAWFKDGKALPKRYVWEIILGAHAQFAKEQSLVEVDLEEGVTCDVIGDVHGKLTRFNYTESLCMIPFPRAILRLVAFILADR